MKAKDFDQAFDDGNDISQYLDLSTAHRPKLEQKRVNVDFPVWMIHQLDKEAKREVLRVNPLSRCGLRSI